MTDMAPNSKFWGTSVIRWKWTPWIATFAVMAGMVLRLHSAGRRWWCTCGEPNLWSGDPQSSHSSQHLFDPYSFTHVLHGILICGILAWAWPRLSWAWGLWGTTSLEALWELLENSQFVIRRYRTATIALGYEGDSIANSMGDVLVCALGFALARKIGLRWSVVMVVVTELILLVWIRDNLLLNIVMLVWPMEAIKNWQVGP